MSIQSKDIAKLAAEALEPFARIAQATYAGVISRDEQAVDANSELASAITVGDLRRAREVRDLLTAAPAIPTETGQGFSGGVRVPRAQLQEVSDLLAERRYGNAARSPAHNARLIVDALLSAIDIPAPAGGEEAARRFHETYERLAPQFGYETRLETREFNPASPNGRLMIAVCEAVSAPDHHLRVEVERLRAELAEKQKWLNWHANRATTAETRIAEMEAALRGIAETRWDRGALDAVLTMIQTDARSALASSTKQVEEGEKTARSWASYEAENSVPSPFIQRINGEMVR